ncbi:uncharacterized protein [Triticum aestivum]|uniref:uncharacterized protein n=1 Tax=Triticum aestivum TaxID=4565 RepID=UPI001ABCEC19|nr:uncharacterized protein LOC109738981 [Aegilops tauschii subsp. strangulata]XP_044449207.1 uncharacterized protein LOC123181056 [Triticum aestivum]
MRLRCALPCPGAGGACGDCSRHQWLHQEVSTLHRLLRPDPVELARLSTASRAYGCRRRRPNLPGSSTVPPCPCSSAATVSLMREELQLVQGPCRAGVGAVVRVPGGLLVTGDLADFCHAARGQGGLLGARYVDPAGRRLGGGVARGRRAGEDVGVMVTKAGTLLGDWARGINSFL